MPNGHGGVPWMGAPLFFAVLAAIAIFLQQPAVAAALAAIAGWRLAYHLHFWNADEYSGAYTDPLAHRRARWRYWCFGALYALAAVAAVSAIA